MPPAQKDSVDATGLELRRVRNRELELKRITGEISCAECRRLKLKCDKKVPCSSCVRRGCKQICPTGTTTGGSSGRQIAINAASAPIANDSDVVRKLTAMSERIRVLEDALQIQDGTSHPLLSAELLAIKQGIDVVQPISREIKDDEDEEALTDAFGTLSVSEDKSMRFLGASASDSVLLMQVFHPSSAHEPYDLSNLPPELVQASGMWPFTPAYLSRSEHFCQLASHLPPYERVTSLTEAYFSNLAWFISPIDRGQVIECIIPIFYPQRRPMSPELVNNENIHDLALLFIVLACGAVADLTQPAINPEAEEFHQLARAALGMRSFLDYGSFSACQAVFLMGSYEVYSGHKTSQESSWKLMSIGMLLASSIGLHRDPSRWKLDARTVNWRRRTFWEINTIDKWRSLGSGRPMSFPGDAIDCEYPLDRGATVEEDGVVIESVWQWRYRFTRDVLVFLSEKICSARPPKYSDVMEMDRVVRDFDLHPFVHHRPRPNYIFATDGEFRNLHPYITLWWKEMALLHVHRNCFARAMLEYPSGPARSPFAASFLSTYRSSTILLQLLRDASERISLILERMWALWSISLSCAVVVGSVATRPSTINFAASALNELEKAIVIFEASSKHPVARNGINLLYRLRDKANAAFQALDVQSSPASTNATNAEKQNASKLQLSRFPRAPDELEDEDEELNILRGTTRYVEQRSIPSNRAVQGSRPHASLTYADPSPSTSMSSRSSDMSTSSESQFSSPSYDASGSIFSTAPLSMNCYLAPSPLVQGPLGSNSHGTVTSAASFGSPNAVHDHCDPYDNYIPPFVEVPRRDLERAGTWASGGEGDRLGVGSAQHGGKQQQVPMQPDQAGPAPPGNRQSGAALPFSGAQGSSVLPQFSVENPYAGMSGRETTRASNASEQLNTADQHAFEPFDYTYDPTSTAQSFFSGPVQDPQVVADLNLLYQKADGRGVEAWDSFMQAFELANAADQEHENWEAMVFT